MMCGISKATGTDAAAPRIRNNQQNNINNNAVFREDQTELLSVFQQSHYDLLEGNPPSHNPNFVSLRPLEHQQQPSPSAFLSRGIDDASAISHRRHHSSSSGVGTSGSLAGANPFYEASVLSARSSSSNNSSQNQNPFDSYYENESHRNSRPAITVPLAAAVAISDTDHDASVPLVAALRIDDDDQTAEIHQGSAAVRAPTVEPISVQPMLRPPPLVFSNEVSPNARQHSSRSNSSLDHSSWASSRTTTPSSHGSGHEFFEERREIYQQFSEGRISQTNPFGDDGSCTSHSGRDTPSEGSSGRSGHHRTKSWSRVSVLARATAGEATRSFRKKVSKESKKLSKELSKESKKLGKELSKESKKLSEESKKLARSTKAMAKDLKNQSRVIAQLTKDMARDQKETIRDMKRRGWYRKP